MTYIFKFFSTLLFAGFSSFAQAGGNFANLVENLSVGKSLPIVEVAANGWADVSEVYFTGGSMVKSAGQNWNEISNTGATFNFLEVGRDTSSIYLRDDSRGVNLELNLDVEKILYSDDSGASYPLYDITGIKGGALNQNQGQVGNATSVTVVEYLCNEGIPLILEFEQVGDDLSVIWTHDQIKGNKLPQVVSGSSNRFSDGRYEVSTKGNSAFVNLDGIEDSCTEVAANNSPANPATDDGLIWSHAQYNDASNKGRTTSSLTFAIPETDAVQIFATCNVGSSGNFSSARFGADVRGMADGQEVTVSFSTGNFQQQLRGSVVGTQAEEGLSGVEIIVDNDDPLWDAMRRGVNLQYTVNGKVSKAALRGSNMPIKKFVEDCKLYAGTFSGGNQSPKPVTNDPRWASCDVPENLKSRDLNQAVTVTFVNKSDGFRGVMWMDFDGKPVSYANLNVGEKFTIETALGHPWMFTDGPGNCIEIYQPQMGQSVFEIAASSPVFGDE